MDLFLKVLVVMVVVILIILVLQDSFETIVLPRRVSRRFRLSRWFYSSTWRLWSIGARKMRLANNRREFYLSYYGPASLIFLLIAWGLVLILAFALFQWGLNDPLSAPEKHLTFGTYLYMSGTTFVTLGYGDVTPLTGFGRVLAVAEAGIGFGFLAMIIGSVPIIYLAFSRRESTFSLLAVPSRSPPNP